MPQTIPVTQLTEKQRRSFTCGVPPLDEYFKQFSKSNHIKNIGKTFVLLGDDGSVMGYYTITMGSMDFDSVPKGPNFRLPKYPTPVGRIARLAVSARWQSLGWGEFLLVDAMHRIRDAAVLIAAYGVVVEAKNEKAKAFYCHFGFIPLIDNDLCLFLPLSSIP